MHDRDAFELPPPRSPKRSVEHCYEPKHAHVRREGMMCKFWLEPISLARNHGFSARELNVIRSYIEEHLARILEACASSGSSRSPWRAITDSQRGG
ncbi:MAG: hypothetical protein DMD91_32135 [Candidatus Rokuibacteriota bacterium]|nr:MAG: hypothetical protein DMD91_32135 [Candidatus Rokubacteria bacterium]